MLKPRAHVPSVDVSASVRIADVKVACCGFTVVPTKGKQRVEIPSNYMCMYSN